MYYILIEVCPNEKSFKFIELDSYFKYSFCGAQDAAFDRSIRSDSYYQIYKVALNGNYFYCGEYRNGNWFD